MKDQIWEFFYWWKTVLLFEYSILQMLSISVQAIHSPFHNLFRPFSNKGYADPPSLLSFDPIFMDDAVCAE